MLLSSGRALVDLLTRHAGRFLRYSGVSVFNVIAGQSLLVLFRSGMGMPAWLANVTAVMVGTLPGFYLSKRFVWRRHGPARMRTELAPFWAMNVAGLLLSTFSAHLAELAWDSQLAVNAASLATWGSLWVVKYAVLDRYLFAERAPGEPVVTG
jgi:putative flippase GtrA